MKIPDWIRKIAADLQPLSDKMLKDMIPLFVEKEKYPDPDHKCGNCNMRVEGEIPTCTIVNQTISLEKGTCVYWAGGEAAPADKIHEERMDPATGGYIEVEGAVNCSTCHHFKNNNYCALWMGTADPIECCNAWSNGQEKDFSGPPQLSE